MNLVLDEAEEVSGARRGPPCQRSLHRRTRPHAAARAIAKTPPIGRQSLASDHALRSDCVRLPPMRAFGPASAAKRKTRKPLGRIMLKGDSITLLTSATV
jgi:small nuclear ribonucleoprotein (snRNP)-like protein